MHDPQTPPAASLRFRATDALRGRALPWIDVAPASPYFMTETGEPWHPIGQNDAISWSELGPLFRRRDVAAVDGHLAWLAAHGVTCLRLMLEYAQVRHRYIEKPAGTFAPAMVRLWDDLFALCEKHGLRILLTPFDTFWQWLHFRHHPYNRRNGGPLDHPSEALIDPGVRAAIKARLTFAVERWGGSGALFAWDLWNEIHPAQAKDSAEPFAEFIADLSAHVRGLERRLFGRSHPQTVSLFGPELHWRPHMRMEEALFRHPDLDFATIHIYEQGTIDYPQNTVDAALGMGRVVAACLGEITDGRPFLDTEHGPIHGFKDRKITLPEPFDDEYFRHMQWAHLASGGAGGGMRWPNRRPHRLTPGMRAAQRAMAEFMPLVDWRRFDRKNVSGAIEVTGPDGTPYVEDRLARFACASADQAVVVLLRRDTLLANGQVDPTAKPLENLRLRVPLENAGPSRITVWDTVRGGVVATQDGDASDVTLPPLGADLALAITPLR